MTEHKFQASLIVYLRENAGPNVLYFSVPNGGLRNGRVAQKMKAEGLRPGVADLCFMLPEGRTAWLELKTDKGRLSDTQRGFQAWCAKLGHEWAMARSLEEAAQWLSHWGVLKPGVKIGEAA